MKPASPELITYLATRRQLKYADCYEFILNDDPGGDDGTVLRYTTATSNVRATLPDGSESFLWEAGRVLVSGLRYRLSVGTDVDEQEVQIAVKPNVMVLGLPFLVAVRMGLFFKATVKRIRYFFTEWNQPPVGGIVFFTGFVGPVQDLGVQTCTVKVKSGMILLNTPMPHELYQPQCLNTLYDARCKLIPGDFGQAGNPESGSTRGVIAWADSVEDDFNQGTIRFASGANMGAIRTIKKSTSGALILAVPLDYDPELTDDFQAYPGCDKSKARCNTRFSNIANFRGYPYVPEPETAM